MGALALCFFDAGRDLGVLDLNISRRVGTCTTWLWIKGKLRFQSHIELFFRIRMELQVRESTG